MSVDDIQGFDREEEECRWEYNLNANKKSAYK